MGSYSISYHRYTKPYSKYFFNPRNKGMKKQNWKYVKRHKIKWEIFGWVIRSTKTKSKCTSGRKWKLFPQSDFESPRLFHSSNLPIDFLTLGKQLDYLTAQNFELDICNIRSTVQYKTLTRENGKLRRQREKATQKVAEKK